MITITALTVIGWIVTIVSGFKKMKTEVEVLKSQVGTLQGAINDGLRSDVNQMGREVAALKAQVEIYGKWHKEHIGHSGGNT